MPAHRTIDWQIISRYAFMVLSVAASVYFFILAVDALFIFIKMRSGFASVGGLFSIVIIGVLELGFIIYAFEKYRTITDRKIAFIRFLTMIAVFGLLFMVLQVFELWTFFPKIITWPAYHGIFWEPRHYFLLIAGCAVGVVAGIFAVLLEKKRKRAV